MLVLVLVCAIPLRGQNTERDGNAWLDANADSAVMNVTGIWNGGDWGLVSLNQEAGGRRIIGSCQGRSKREPLGRSKREPVDGQRQGFRGRRGAGA